MYRELGQKPTFIPFMRTIPSQL